LRDEHRTERHPYYQGEDAPCTDDEPLFDLHVSSVSHLLCNPLCDGDLPANVFHEDASQDLGCLPSHCPELRQRRGVRVPPTPNLDIIFDDIEVDTSCLLVTSCNLLQLQASPFDCIAPSVAQPLSDGSRRLDRSLHLANTVPSDLAHFVQDTIGMPDGSGGFGVVKF
jgi:hypothetical protein